MKYIILLGDGMADYPIPELGNKTPLQSAEKPNMDLLAREGEIGMAVTIPQGFPPGSDVANLSVLGYDPRRYYTGRSPMEAASMGINLGPRDVAFRCNLVTLKDSNNSFELKKINSGTVMMDYSAGHISTDEAREIIMDINEQLGTEVIQFYPGVSYRHLMVWDGGSHKTQCTPPHDITGKKVMEYLPKGDGDEVLKDLMQASIGILVSHPVNRDRIAEGKPPANCLWLWGQGRAPTMPTYIEKYSISGAVVAAVDLVKGLGKYAGFDIIDVPGATGYIDTNYKGKAEYALKALEKKDLVFVHVEAPDEASHTGDIKIKLKAIEDFDNLVVGTVLEGVKKFDRCRVMVLCDHRTSVSLKTHTGDPVPFLIYENSKDRAYEPSGKVFDEIEAEKSPLRFSEGYRLMDYFIKGKK